MNRVFIVSSLKIVAAHGRLVHFWISFGVPFSLFSIKNNIKKDIAASLWRLKGQLLATSMHYGTKTTSFHKFWERKDFFVNVTDTSLRTKNWVHIYMRKKIHHVKKI